jgi:hypothetical protein
MVRHRPERGVSLTPEDSHTPRSTMPSSSATKQDGYRSEGATRGQVASSVESPVEVLGLARMVRRGDGSVNRLQLRLKSESGKTKDE